MQLLVHHRITTLVTELRTRDPLVRERLPEGVHTMRVAIRRLRSTLSTCRPFLDRSVTDPLRDELAWLADALGEVRDAEVRRTRLDESVDALVEDRPEVDWDGDHVRSALWSPLVEQHERAGTALEEVMTSERYARLLDRLRGLVADPPWTVKAAKRVRGAYRRRTRRELDRVHRRMEVALEPDRTPDERAVALHEARKAVKRARYAVEPLRPVYGDSAKTLTKSLKRLQSALGQHQDTVVTRGYLHGLSRQTRPSLHPAALLAAGALIERESRAAEKYDARAVSPPGARSPRVPGSADPRGGPLGEHRSTARSGPPTPASIRRTATRRWCTAQRSWRSPTRHPGRRGPGSSSCGRGRGTGPRPGAPPGRR